MGIWGFLGLGSLGFGVPGGDLIPKNGGGGCDNGDPKKGKFGGPRVWGLWVWGSRGVLWPWGCVLSPPQCPQCPQGVPNVSPLSPQEEEKPLRHRPSAAGTPAAPPRDPDGF